MTSSFMNIGEFVEWTKDAEGISRNLDFHAAYGLTVYEWIFEKTNVHYRILEIIDPVGHVKHEFTKPEPIL